MRLPEAIQLGQVDNRDAFGLIDGTANQARQESVNCMMLALRLRSVSLTGAGNPARPVHRSAHLSMEACY